ENDWQDKVTQGEGESYGLELFLQKKAGKTTGWIGYTLSWNWRQFDEINGGRRYPFRYDRRHDVSVVINHDFSKRVGLSAAWVYGTGNAVTLNTFRYPGYIGQFTDIFGNTTDYVSDVESGGERNAFRMRDYHRLDISLELRKQRPKSERKWVFGVYNAYWRRNPYFMTTGSVFENGVSRRVFREVSILPIIPSVSYQFKF
ncbi:MAG TPA: TonB-dependent receptor, partial [Saprospiraceae bacterium]|nr:TonB-dependent receptor [Saprospiraceae bacterium]